MNFGNNLVLSSVPVKSTILSVESINSTEPVDPIMSLVECVMEKERREIKRMLPYEYCMFLIPPDAFVISQKPIWDQVLLTNQTIADQEVIAYRFMEYPFPIAIATDSRSMTTFKALVDFILKRDKIRKLSQMRVFDIFCEIYNLKVKHLDVT